MVQSSRCIAGTLLLPLVKLRRTGHFPGPCGTAHDTLRTASSESPDPYPDVCRFVTFRCLTIEPNPLSGQDLVSVRDCYGARRPLVYSLRLVLVPFTPKRMGSVAYSLIMFLVVSVLAGMAGVTSNAAAAELESLPSELATPAPATRSKVLMGNGKTLAYFYDENRIPVKLKDIAPIMRQAQIAIEDHRFYEHGALDFKGTMRALVRNSAAGGTTQGGSSITQQYVKMVQIESCQAKGDSECVREAQAPTVERKIRELRYAIAMEKKFNKDQILERYVNIAYYGEGAYGAEAAARHYFSSKASKLTLPQ